MDLVIQEDDQATIRIVETGYSPKLRHTSRTHKVNLGSLNEILHDKGIKIECVETDKQVADIFTKALEPLKWPNALQLMGMRTQLVTAGPATHVAGSAGTDGRGTQVTGVHFLSAVASRSCHTRGGIYSSQSVVEDACYFTTVQSRHTRGRRSWLLPTNCYRW